MRRLSLMGELRLVLEDGRAAELRAKKPKALLAYLALAPGACTRERLAALLWGDMGDERARANLRQALVTLRDALDDPDGRVLVTDDSSVRLDAGALAVDVLEVRRLAQGDNPADWVRAAALVHGELLADVVVNEEVFEEWRAAERRALVASLRDLYARIATARASSGDVPGADKALESWLALEPASEEAHRALMLHFAATGRRARAIEQFEVCRAELGRALGVAPDEATCALHARLVRPTAPAAPASAPARPSIAVLPFAADDRWLGDGVAEDLISALSRFERLMIVARQSSFVFRGVAADVLQIGRALGVSYVASGSVRRAGDKLRISVELADATSGAALWAQPYRGTAGDLFVLEDDITRSLVATLAGRVEADRMARVRREPTTSLAAWDCLLKAKAHHHLFTAEDNAAARKCLEHALTLDPCFALAHAWLACVIVQSAAWTGDPGVFEVGYRAVARAEELDDQDSESHRVLASYFLLRRRFDEARRHQARAFALNPNDDRIVCQEGELLTYLGRAPEGVGWIEQAMRLNPYHADGFFGDYGRALFHTRRYGECVAALSRIAAPRPSHHAYLAAALARAGDTAGAARHVASIARVRGSYDPDAIVGGLPYADDDAAAELCRALRDAAS